jgi:hypothetical protein
VAALIWPLLNRLNRTVAMQRRPVAYNARLLPRPISQPWNFAVRPVPTSVDTRLWDTRSGLPQTAVKPAVVKSLSLTWLVVGRIPPPADMRQASRIIWPLFARLFFNPDRITRQAPENTNLRAAVHGLVYNQQLPRATGSQIRVRPLRPWERAGGSKIKPSVVHNLPLPARIAMISGVTRDGAGAILGSCRVELYETATDLPLQTVTSDAVTGAFTFTAARYAPTTHYIVAYKAGSPDRAGTTLNTLTGL